MTQPVTLVTQLIQGPPGPPAASVANTAALAALPLTNVTWPNGTIVFVQASGGTYWSWYPTGTTAPAGSTTTAGNGGVWAQWQGGGAPGTPAYDPVWFALTDIYWDPGNSSGLAGDSNAGTSTTTPLLTWGQIVQRYGGTSPTFNYGQSVTVHMMSAQPAGQDPVFFEPLLSGGGQAILNALTYAPAAGASFLAGALSGGYGYAGATASAGGVEMTMAAVPGYVVAGVLLYNSTRASYAFVDSVSGGNAKLSQPQTAASLTATAAVPAPVVDNDWVAGDTIEALTLPNLNVKRWSPKGGDVTAGGQPSGGWIIGASIADTSGSGASEYELHGGTVNVLSLCTTTGRLQMSAEGGRGNAAFVLGCNVRGAIANIGGEAIVYGGTTASLNTLSGLLQVYNNAVIHGAVNIESGLFYVASSGCFADGAWDVFSGSAFDCVGNFWGSYSLTLLAGSTFFANGVGFAAAALLTNGTLKLGTATTGTSYLAGVWADGVALTPANLDTNNGLQNPRSGARFTNGS